MMSSCLHHAPDIGCEMPSNIGMLCNGIYLAKEILLHFQVHEVSLIHTLHNTHLHVICMSYCIDIKRCKMASGDSLSYCNKP